VFFSFVLDSASCGSSRSGFADLQSSFYLILHNDSVSSISLSRAVVESCDSISVSNWRCASIRLWITEQSLKSSVLIHCESVNSLHNLLSPKNSNCILIANSQLPIITGLQYSLMPPDEAFRGSNQKISSGKLADETGQGVSE
jgi:hypothetical protein